MTALTADDVHCAIETLETSYTYDPPSRLLDAYRLLQTLRRELDKQIEPYAWIRIAASVVAIGTFVSWGAYVFADPLNERVVGGAFNWLLTTAMWSLPIVTIGFGDWLTIKLATQRHPLIAFIHRIDNATGRFDKVARDVRSDSSNAST